MGAAAVPIILAATAVAASGAQAYQARQGRKEAKKQAKEQEQRANAIRAEAEAEERKGKKLASRRAAVAKRAAIGAAGAKRRETILTSGTGVIGQPQTANKTLLGS